MSNKKRVQRSKTVSRIVLEHPDEQPEEVAESGSLLTEAPKPKKVKKKKKKGKKRKSRRQESCLDQFMYCAYDALVGWWRD